MSDDIGDPETERTTWTRPIGHSRSIGLVFGAGGTVGAAFHAGTLLALEQDLRWDPRTADVIVGSSAGSIVGALLRAGLSSDDLAAWAASVDARPDGADSRRLLDAMEQSPRALSRSKPRPRMPSRALLTRLASPKQLRLHTAGVSLLPHGWIDASTGLQRLDELVDGWPQEKLWINAVRSSDARRVVFGRDRHDDVTLGRAVAASCAIPAVFRPVRINGDLYIDGGAHSPTNADVLSGSGVETAIIVSPMSGRVPATRHRVDRVPRTLFARRLDVERRDLERVGIRVHVFEPDAPTLAAMGYNPLNRSRTGDIVRCSFLAAGEQLANSQLGDILRPPAARHAPMPRG